MTTSPPLKQYINNAFNSERLAHSFILSGNNELAAEELTQHLLHLLLCQSINEGKACGDQAFISPCNSCQLVNSNINDLYTDDVQSNHPDIHVLKPPEPGKDIKIDDVRDIQKVAEESPLISKSKVIVINPADHLNVASANCLLKILEEPSSTTYFILRASSHSLLLNTITSRSQILRLPETAVPSPEKSKSQQCLLDKDWSGLNKEITSEAKFSSRKISASQKRQYFTEALNNLILTLRQSLVSDSSSKITWTGGQQLAAIDIIVTAIKDISFNANTALCLEGLCIKLERV